jgi:hypothetical protein
VSAFPRRYVVVSMEMFVECLFPSNGNICHNILKCAVKIQGYFRCCENAFITINAVEIHNWHVHNFLMKVLCFSMLGPAVCGSLQVMVTSRRGDFKVFFCGFWHKKSDGVRSRLCDRCLKSSKCEGQHGNGRCGPTTQLSLSVRWIVNYIICIWA